MNRVWEPPYSCLKVKHVIACSYRAFFMSRFHGTHSNCGFPGCIQGSPLLIVAHLCFPWVKLHLRVGDEV